MLQSEQGLIIFVSAMDPYNENMMADVLRVAAAVCLVADGYVEYISYFLCLSCECVCPFTSVMTSETGGLNRCHDDCLLSETDAYIIKHIAMRGRGSAPHVRARDNTPPLITLSLPPTDTTVCWRQ